MAQHTRNKHSLDANLKDICEVRGKVSDETAVKRYFAPFSWNDKPEVFWPVPEVHEYVRWLRDRWFVSVPELIDSERDAMEARESTEWLPSPERRKKHPLDVEKSPEMLFSTKSLFDWYDFPPREITGDDFYTNEIIIDAARATMGRIDLDPASHAIANRVIKASKFFTLHDNGLAHQWAGRVWLNPPFSAWSQWVVKVLSEWNTGRIEQMCVLSAMRTVTARYFSPLLSRCDAMCIIKGRIKFWGGVAGDSPDDGHAIFYFGNSVDVFNRHFAPLGTVFYGTGGEA